MKPTKTLYINPNILTGGRNVSTDGTALVYIEIIQIFIDDSRQTKREPTIIRVKPKDFDRKNRVVLPSDETYEYKNDIILRKLNMIKYQLANVPAGVPKSTPIDLLFQKNSKGLIEYIDDYIEYRKKKKTNRGTLKEFVSCKNRLKRYEEKADVKLQFKDMNLLFADKFEIFLDGENFQSGTKHKTFTILITILNYYYDRQDAFDIRLSAIFKSRSFKRGKPSENDPNPLSIIEFRTLLEYKFETETLTIMKDRFLWQCATGMRYSDAFKITPNKFVNECIHFEPNKTVNKRDNRVVLPLNPLSKSIAEKYEYDMTRLKISNQKYNDGLEEMFNVLIQKKPDVFTHKYTSHNGRDTFITNYLEEGVDPVVLMKMVGQTDYKVMQRYYKASMANSVANMNRVTLYDVTL